MRQSRAMSLTKSISNVVVGYGLAVAAQLVAFPWFGRQASLSENLALGGVFTGISLLRSYALRGCSSASGSTDDICMPE